MGFRHQLSIPLDTSTRNHQGLATIRAWTPIRNNLEASESTLWAQDITKTMAAASQQHLGQRAQVPSKQM
eukprot:264662-Amphidinium_carterae.1